MTKDECSRSKISINNEMNSQIRANSKEIIFDSVDGIQQDDPIEDPTFSSPKLNKQGATGVSRLATPQAEASRTSMNIDEEIEGK